MKTRVLFVDDDEAMRGLMDMRLTNRGFSVKTASSAAAALEAIAQGPFDAVVTDINMQGGTGLQLCRQVMEARPNLPVILVTAFGSLASAIAAIRAGAYDFLPKPFELEQLVLAIERGA
ncbi:MAG: response regulator, partial [Polyangiaceae bacterium]|nr:response regulator [Polyangiaceae bacterium]